MRFQDPPVVWTEDYQVVLMEQNFKAFDQLRQMGFLIGEMIWNFADFATPQGQWYFLLKDSSWQAKVPASAVDVFSGAFFAICF